MWFPALWVQIEFLSRCLILLNGKVSRRSIFGVQVSENGTRPSRFLADYSGAAADRISRIASGNCFGRRAKVCVQTQDFAAFRYPY